MLKNRRYAGFRYINNRTPNLTKSEKDKFNELLIAIMESGNGALLIITNDAQTEVDRLCEKNRGIDIEGIDLRSEDVLKALTAIDGALILDKKCICHGIGIILDGDATANGTPARGSRFNSAKNFVARRLEEALRYDVKDFEMYAVIVSEDGYIDIIASHDDEFKASIGNKRKYKRKGKSK